MGDTLIINPSQRLSIAWVMNSSILCLPASLSQLLTSQNGPLKSQEVGALVRIYCEAETGGHGSCGPEVASLLSNRQHCFLIRLLTSAFRNIRSKAKTHTETRTSLRFTSLRARFDNSWKLFKALESGSMA